MIKIKIYIKEQEIQGFEISGHANYSEAGQDIVCAAVSMVSQTAVLGLDHFLERQIKLKIAEGYLNCFLPSQLTEGERLQSKAILETMYLGLTQVAEDYPELVKVEKEEVTRHDFEN